MPDADRPALTVLLGELPGEDWLTIDLHKRRRRWHANGWTLEVTAVTGRRTGWTAAWEGPEPRHPAMFKGEPVCRLVNLDYGAWLRGRNGTAGTRTFSNGERP